MAKITSQFDMHDRITNKLKLMLRAFRSVDSAIDNSMRGIRRLNSTTISPRVRIDDTVIRNLDEIRDRLRRVDDTRADPEVRVTDNASSVIDRIDAKLSALQGKVLMGLGALGLSGGGLALAGMNAMDMDSHISAVTGIDKSRVTSDVRDIYYGQNVGRSREEVGTSYINMKQQANLTGSALTDAVKVSNTFAQLYNKDIPEVDRAITSMYKSLKLVPTEAGDMLAYIAKNAGDQYEDLLDTMNEYSSTFAKLNLNPKQIAGAFVAGSAGGARNFDDMADAMREFGIRGYEMSDNQMAAWEKVLGSESAMKSMYKGLADGSTTGTEALIELSTGLSKVQNRLVREQIATELLGSKFEDLGKPILDMAAGIEGAAEFSGELNKQWTTLKGNNPMTPLASAMSKIKSFSEDTGMTIMTKLSPSFERLNNFLSSPEGQQGIAKISASITSLAVVMGDSLANGIQYVVENWDTLLPILKTTGIIIGTLFVGTKLIKFGQGAAQAAGSLKNFGMAAWSLGTKIKNFAATGTVIASISRFASGFGAVFMRVLGVVRPFLPWLGRAALMGIRFVPILGWIVTAATLVYYAFKNWDSIKDFGSNLMSGLKSAFTTGMNMLINIVNAGIAKVNKALAYLPDWMGGNKKVPSIPTIPVANIFGDEEATQQHLSEQDELNRSRVPQLAEGGRSKGSTLAVIGEGKYEEAVLPLSEGTYSEIAKGLNNSLASRNSSTSVSSGETKVELRIEAVHIHNEDDENKFFTKLTDALRSIKVMGGSPNVV